MSDQDIIDTIAEALTPWEQRTDESHCELQAREAVAALRSAGYAVVRRRDIEVGLAVGDSFRTPAAAGARMELRGAVAEKAAEK